MPIVHCVFVNFRSTISADHKAEIYQDICALQAHLPGMLSVVVGSNVSPEGLDRGYRDGFIVTFVDAAARDQYLNDPAHRLVGAKIVAATQGGLEGVFVYDLQVDAIVP